MVDISIIPYVEDKAEDLCVVHNSVFKSYIKEFGLLYGYKLLTPSDIYHWIKNLESKIWITYVDNKPVGYIHCSLEVKKKDNKITVLHFVATVEGRSQSKIAVIPSFRKKGVAKALVRHAIEYYKKFGAEIAIAEAYNDNILASQFFKKLGFKHNKYQYFDKYSKTEPAEVDSVLATFDLTQSLPIITLNQEVNVRVISKDDLPAIGDIFGKARPDMWGSNPTMKQIKGWYKEGWGEVTLVAEFEGEVVGCMEYNSTGAIGIPGVLPQYRRKGIGSTLFYHLLKTMKERGLLKALSDSGYMPERREAIRMYKRFNFNLSRELWEWVKIV